MKILITGSDGFIGKNLVKALKHFVDFEVFLFHRSKQHSFLPNQYSLDLTDEVLVRYFLDQIRPDCIIHLAANPNVNAKSSDLIRNNISSTFNLLENAPEGCRFILASSATVYGEYHPSMVNSALQKTKIVKGGFKETDPLCPSSIYAATKMASETYVDMFSKEGIVRGVSLRFSANCGPNATHGVVNAIINKLQTEDEFVELLGEFPGSKKPITYIGDTIDAIFKCIKSDYCGPLNISVEDSIHVEEIANIIMDELAIDKAIKWLGKETLWEGDDQCVLLNCEKAKKEIGWYPSYVTSEEAIKRTCTNYLNKKLVELMDGQYH